MTPDPTERVRRFRQKLRDEYELRFPHSAAHYRGAGGFLLDSTSHAVRWNEPFMPLVRHAAGAAVEDLDGHRIVDYWQGHFANLLGHNPEVVREALIAALADGRGLQSGMVHPIESEVAELLCTATGMETCRLTTSGSLATFYSVVLARAFTGRDRVLKVGGGWHGSQPFGLKGVSPHAAAFDRMESEGLSTSTGAEIVLTRLNDIDDLRRQFADRGDRIACFIVEPLLGSAGGMLARADYLQEARRLTERHGALLLCDEIITGFRFHPGSLSSLLGVTPDLLILGKVIGGGMPVAAVAGRRDVLSLTTRDVGRVKFEGGTYSAHELSLVAARTLLSHLNAQGGAIYPRLGELGARTRAALVEISRDVGVPLSVLGALGDLRIGSSLVYFHVCREDGPVLTCPEELAESRNPLIGERLLKSTLLLEDVSSRSGLGAISLAHDDRDIEQTLRAVRAALERFRGAGLA